MDQRFCFSVSSDKKDQFLCDVNTSHKNWSFLANYPVVPSVHRVSLKQCFFVFFNVMFNVFYNGSFPANESDIVYIESLYNRGEPILTHDL